MGKICIYLYRANILEVYAHTGKINLVSIQHCVDNTSTEPGAVCRREARETWNTTKKQDEKCLYKTIELANFHHLCSRLKITGSIKKYTQDTVGRYTVSLRQPAKQFSLPFQALLSAPEDTSPVCCMGNVFPQLVHSRDLETKNDHLLVASIFNNKSPILASKNPKSFPHLCPQLL